MSGAHPITGIIVLVLSVIQPIAAAFRPHPGDDKYAFFVTFVEFRDVVTAIDLLLLTDYSSFFLAVDTFLTGRTVLVESSPLFWLVRYPPIDL